jgi:hypothetical protein
MAISYISTGNGPALVASAVVPLGITWAFAGVRVYVRWIMMRIWKVEDWLFIGSQVRGFPITHTPSRNKIFV